ncbi:MULTISPECIES: FxLYD domain-containing protein [unclassified Variovorax]|jgi:DNA-directed RNA polymerase subunit RPC12/RpoP|uniref:FxLYD domain-containing protein n=1 Tax=unclassified Variovorax TaxID=663243 RepID=UPI000F7FA39B|nr:MULTISPECIES: FxLYD domain-containing protein [unclassified Variovorax]RSZ42545.1 TFIIB-type zinc ribbon-containing protein [Variovorax sp. 553]RSZ43520.1 TFIIB-type zinc ribbon-containing protein [Variovorax sp. 679]
MTIDLQTLKCGECGSSVLKRTGLNEYTCEHCGSVTLVEDNVSDRLERVLDQVKNEAGRRLAAEEARKQALMMRKVGIGVAVAVVLFSVVGVFLGSRNADTRGASGSQRVVAAVDRTIPVDGLKLDEPRQVLVGSGSSASPKLLVVARNETGKPLSRAGIRAVYFDGENKLDERSEMLPVSVLEPGESAPALIDMPSGKNVTRQELRVQKLAEPYSAVKGLRMALSRVRLVQQGDRVRLVGRIVNDRKDAAVLGGFEVLATLYDDAGQVIGFGHGYGQANEIKPGARTSVDVSISRFGRAAAIAAWDYRVGYSTVDASGARTPVLTGGDRVIRTAGGPETFNPELRLGTDDLLADDSERFDDKLLELLPLVDGRNNIQQRLFLGELVNRSTDAVVLAPGGVISRFSGSKAHGTTTIAGLAYLYPGERFPIFLEPQDMERFTDTRIEWKPMRRAALPGPRKPLEVKVTGTKAATGSVLLNFSQRFAYKYVEVSGSVKNPGTGIVGKVRLWVSLRDRNGQLTGFKLVENLPAIAPGESVPFQVSVEQNGRDFASVTTLYQTE